ncbi:MAG: SRPBCC domain-containing protein [Actinomycetota bacterium]
MARQLHTQIDIDATPEVVWSVLTDLDRYPEWNPFVVSSEGRVAVGERLTNRLEPPGGRAMTFRPTVTEVEADRTFEWLGRLVLPGLFDGRHRFQLESLPGGGTRLVHSERFTGVLVPVLWRSLESSTRAGFEAMNAALKSRVEEAS